MRQLWSGDGPGQRQGRRQLRLPGGYLGACTNHLLVRRTLAEKLILEAVRERTADAGAIHYVLEYVESVGTTMYSDVRVAIRPNEAELQADERRLANFVDFIGEGRSRALASALAETERPVEALRDEVDGLGRSWDAVFQAPPVEWIEDRLAKLRPLLGQATERFAQLLRQILGTLRSEPTKGDIGRPYYQARTQRIRTASALPLEMQVDQTESPPAYQRIAPRVLVLHQAALSDSAIGRLLGVTDKTVRKSIKWHLEQRRPSPR